MKISRNDTIAAVSTPPGEGALAVIRVSGTEAFRIAERVFKPARTGAISEPGKALFGTLRDRGHLLDQVVLTCFKSPHSYTGEDMAEFSCHGGRFTAESALALILKAGARPAEPGEFTRRAFLNSKMDLVQAEAVAELIRADTEKAHRAAMLQLTGALSSRFKAVADSIKEMLTLVEANLDFAEEDVALFEPKIMKAKVETVKQAISALLNTFDQGRMLAAGVRVALIGPPNAGKSSLFNALCEKERVIVDEHPGTTRDLVEESVAMQGIKVTLIDTAGIRKTGGRVEKKGMDLARKAAQEADITLVVLDASARLSVKEIAAFREIPCRKKLIIFNKSDLTASLKLPPDLKGIRVSAKTGEGIDGLKKALLKESGSDRSEGESAVLTSARQHGSLIKTSEALDEAVKLLAEDAGEELIAVEFRAALSALQNITGEVTDDDILNAIFSQFCIGK